MSKTITISLVILVLLFFLYPYMWVITASLQSDSTIFNGNVKFIPDEASLENYIPLFTSEYGINFFFKYLLNSIYVGLPTAILSTIIAAMSAYSLSRYPIPGKEIFAKLLLLIYVFPTVLMILPVEGIMAHFKLINTKLSLIIIHTALAVPFCTWLLRSFFEAVPKDIEEAAIVDGCGKFRTFISIILPLTAPGVVTVFIYSLVSSWGEYLFASILIRSNELKTLPLGLAMYTTDQYIEWGKLLAGTVVIFVPLLIIFIPLSRYFIKGFLEGAIKL